MELLAAICTAGAAGLVALGALVTMLSLALDLESN